VATLLEGGRATLRLLDEALNSVGIEQIDPNGEPFDPTRHEAIGMLPSAHLEPDSVLEVVQKGYLVHERVLRPARVLVARAPNEGEG
jgi:molecular chaperone GrpE